jgi:hypothetical protein
MGMGGSGRRRTDHILPCIRRKDDVHGTVHDHLEDLVKADETVVHHQPVLVFDALTKPTLKAKFHGVKDLCWHFAVGGNVSLEDDFFGEDRRCKGFYASDNCTSLPKQDRCDSRVKKESLMQFFES